MNFPPGLVKACLFFIGLRLPFNRLQCSSVAQSLVTLGHCMHEMEQTMLAECFGALLNVPADKPKPRQET